MNTVKNKSGLVEFKHPSGLVPANPANVMVEYGLTLNLGNYESARLAVSVTVPCAVEEIDATHAAASQWVESKVMQERKNLLAELRDVQSGGDY